MKYKLRVRLDDVTVLERTVEADEMVIDHVLVCGQEAPASTDGIPQRIRLEGRRAAIVALQHGVDNGEFFGPVTKFDCLLSLEPLSREEEPQ